MRPKVVLVIMLVAVGALGLMVVLNGILAPHDRGPLETPASVDSNQTTEVRAPVGPSRTSGARVPIGRSNADAMQAAVTPANVPVVTASNSQPVPPITSVVATTPAEDRQIAINKEINQIKDAMLAGASNPVSLTAVRERLQSPEPEVRKAAVSAAMHLNDRGAIPILKAALDQVKDTREKVNILDAIEYLQIPESTEPITNANASSSYLDLPRSGP